MAGPSVNDYTWTWSPAAGLSTTTGASVIANPTVETTYTATGTPIVGCLEAPVAYSIVVKLNTGANLTPTIAGISSICSGNPAVLDAGAGYSSYLWSTTETTETISVTTSGAYSVTVSSASGCTGSASTYVTVNASPIAGYTFSPDSAFAPITVNFTDTSSSVGGNIVNWQWNFGDGSYGTGPTPSHEYNTAGTYQVTLVVTNNTGCVDTVVDTVTVLLVTSICDINNVSFSIYPNPVTNNLTIESSQQAIIEIFNIQGQLIENLAASSRKTIIDISDFPNGVYVMEMKTDKGIAVKKFVKE
jgi:PKD repeat protein